jgi:hypothetical protein
MSIDESFDIGSDTRTSVDDSYEVPFHFTGTIDKLTFNLGPSQLTADDQKKAAELLAHAHDYNRTRTRGLMLIGLAVPVTALNPTILTGSP